MVRINLKRCAKRSASLFVIAAISACGGDADNMGGGSGNASSSSSSSSSSGGAMPLPLESQVFAFPGAEGHGRNTLGGRGGEVYEVTNLKDSGPGSLRAAVTATVPRTVVFRVSGTIDLQSELKILHPYITIAGQTAPGDGIALKRYPLVIAADEVIIRYLRVRLGGESGGASDAVSSRYFNNIVIDHVSASWSVDEAMSIYHCENVTVQWSIISESLYMSNHDKGVHGFGGIWGSNNSSYHHNLLAHHTARNPRFSSGSGHTDFRNNVIYNWAGNSSHGGEQNQKSDDRFNFTFINLVANYYKPGPATEPGPVSYRIVNPGARGGDDFGQWYIADNVMDGNDTVTKDNWNGGVQTDEKLTDFQALKQNAPWPAIAITQQTAIDAYNSVLENAGATLPKRDSVDTRIVNETRGGYATYDGKSYKQQQAEPDTSQSIGIIDSPADVGGWPQLNSAPAPLDSDHDGMPDEWEITYGLNPKDMNDGRKLAADGYTMLEKYLNSID